MQRLPFCVWPSSLGVASTLSQMAGSPFSQLKIGIFSLDVVLHILTLWENKDLSGIRVRGHYSRF